MKTDNAVTKSQQITQSRTHSGGHITNTILRVCSYGKASAQEYIAIEESM